MANYKGTNLELLRNMLKDKGPEAEAAFYGKLTPEETALFKSILPFSWVPLEKAANFFSISAPILFPHASNGMIEIGKFHALHNFKGIFRAILTLSTPAFAIEKSPIFWRIHYDAGKMSAKVDGKTAVLRLFEIANFPPAMVDIVTGYVLGGLEFTKAKNHKINSKIIDANLVEWKFTWD